MPPPPARSARPSAADPFPGEALPPVFSARALAGEFDLDPRRLQNAVKVALAAVATMVVAFVYDWPSPALAMLATVVITRPDFHLASGTTLVLVAAALLSGLVGTLVLNLSQDPLPCCLVLGGWVTLFGALSLTQPLGPVFLVTAQIAALVFVLGFRNPDPVTTVAFARTAELLLGGGLALLVNRLVWPYSPTAEWERQFRRAWAGARADAARLFAAPGEPGTAAGRLTRFLTTQLLLLGKAQQENPADRAGHALRARATLLLERLLATLETLARTLRADADARERFLARAGADWPRLGAALDGVFGRAFPPAAGHPSEDDRAAPLGRLATLARECIPGATDDAPALAGSLAATLRGLSETLDEATEVFRQLTAYRDAAGGGNDAPPPPAAEGAPRPGFPWKNLALNVAQWTHGVKIALAVVLSIYLWFALDWPSGQTLVLTTLLVTLGLGDLGATAGRSLMRLLGVFLGGLAALGTTIFVVPHVETIWGYGLAVFAVLFGFAYLNGSSARTSYVGFQANVTFVLTMIGANQQSVALDPIRQRFVATLLGLAIALGVFSLVRPVRVGDALRARLAGTLADAVNWWRAVVHPVPEAGSDPTATARREAVGRLNQDLGDDLRLLADAEFERDAADPFLFQRASATLRLEQTLVEQIGGLSHVAPAAFAELGAADERTRRALTDATARQEDLFDRLARRLEHAGTDADNPPPPPAGTTTPAVSPGSPALLVYARRLDAIERTLRDLDRVAQTRAAPAG